MLGHEDTAVNQPETVYSGEEAVIQTTADMKVKWSWDQRLQSAVGAQSCQGRLQEGSDVCS